MNDYRRYSGRGWSIVIIGFLGYVASAQPLAAQGTVSQVGSVTVLTLPNAGTNVDSGIDFVNAQPMRLPSVPGRSPAEAQQDLINTLISGISLGVPGHSPAGRGNGLMNPINLGAPASAQRDDITPQEFGTTNHPFSTAQADTSFPYQAAGKLFFLEGGQSFVCSASMVTRGIVVTAAHCVANFGQQQFYSNWMFAPAYSSGIAPYGVWSAANAYVLTAYYEGSDPCAQPGVICQDDVAIIVLNAADDGSYAGDYTGWYGYGYDGYGFTGSGTTQITQLGYPVCLDNGEIMERNDSSGYVSGSQSNNTLIGSLMCGGSSGGPWLINFGVRPGLTGTDPGTYPDPSIVVGVTSWGYTGSGPKEMGASPFTSGNVVPLVSAGCAFAPSACF